METDRRNGDRGTRYRLLYLLRRGHLAARFGLEDLVRAQGLASSDYTALSFLNVLQPCSTAELARAQRISPQAATQQVAQLKAKGFVTSVVNEANRRLSSVSMTDEGHRRFARMDAMARALEDRMMADLTPLERGMILSLLRKLIASAEKMQPPPFDD